MTNSAGAEADGSRGAFSVDSTVAGAAPQGFFHAFQRGWDAELGDGLPLRSFNRDVTGDFRVRSRAAKVRDLALTDIHSMSAIRTAHALGGVEDRVRMYVVKRGAWTLDGSRDRDRHTVSAGQFLLRHVGRPWRFEAVPHTMVKIILLPTVPLTPLLGNRAVTGPADSAEVRLLVAHANMVYETMAGLGPAGVQAAHSTLLELAQAVARRRFDDVEPRLAPALARAAKDLADSHLTDPELSPTMLARELNVSLRTLQRAFTVAEESLIAYIRHRRLEEARRALIASAGRLSVSELAAHWQFADSSHFIRSFKKAYGQTPAEYARSTGPAES
ncbi:helix-turn-helix transcriptional regulator [Streptomyces iranensis]|uniref:helix-turn-helix transcriptional regulator n=1 Tax=Streptomyces iranensis TaxID=576784 RepID=UPI0039B77469